MNDNNCIIVINGENKTDSIAQCIRTNTGYDVTYKSNSRKYPYGFSKIQILPLKGQVDCKGSKIYVNGTPKKNILKILDYGEWKKLVFENGGTTTRKAEDVHLEANCLQHQKAADKLSYLSELAEQISLKLDDGSSILSKYYKTLDFVGEDCVLGFYLSPERELDKTTLTYPIIFPFGLNPSQKKAVTNALTSRVSIIEGPPGTGKTQTILNIIANIIIQGKTIAVVSGNNSATANVLEKLEKNHFDFICAPLGSNENKETFLKAQSGRYPDISSWGLPAVETVKLKSIIRQLVDELDEMLAAQNRIAEIREQISALEREKKYFDSYYEKLATHILINKPNLKANSDLLLDLWLEYEKFAEKSKMPGLWFRIKTAFIYGLESFNFLKQPIDQIIPVLQDIYYGVYQRELKKEQSLLKEKLNGYRFHNKMKELSNKSMTLFRAVLMEKYGTDINRKQFLKEDLWKNSTDFLKEYPVILSTTHSIRSSLTKDCVFDYVIIDEASQVDIVTGALAFANAKNAVIVGDLMQLPNVVTQENQEAAAIIASNYNLEPGYDFVKHSLLSSAVSIWKQVSKTMLREHYRCHPKIIGFCNQKFYNNQLVIMTEDQGEKDVIKLHYTKPGDHARGRMNQRQIDVITNEIIPELGEPLEKIGIISPYRDQANAVTKQTQDSWIEAETVHKYQGREKDNIIVSTVDNQIGAFADNPNLLNVAVSRAVKRLRLVVSPDEANENTNTGDLIKYIRYQNFDIVHSEVSSIFDLLYKQYAKKRLEYLKRHKRVSEYDSENMMYGLLRYLLVEEPFGKLGFVMHYQLSNLLHNMERLTGAQLAYVSHAATHLDFVIFNRMDKKPVLAVEVDGTSYHKEGSRQYERDQMKDEILKICGIPILRLATDGSSEEQRLRDKLCEILNA